MNILFVIVPIFIGLGFVANFAIAIRDSLVGKKQ